MTSSEKPSNPTPDRPLDFVREIVANDITAGKYSGQIVTRFPPEPNGYLHIGHAKAICLNFGIAREFGGRCNLRLDDTNPTKEDTEYVDSIITDVRWLIKGWADHCLGFKAKDSRPSQQGQDFYLGPVNSDAPANKEWEPFYASDYFDQIYEFAIRLIQKGKAYVCDLSPEDTDKFRGAPDRPGKESPFRTRSVDENLDLFKRMRAGEFPDAARTLRAKIDMGAPNVWLRDPVLYRIRHSEHHRTGPAWCIYPMYDFAHCLSDYIEGITHSICTLEFEVHRPLYDWILNNLDLPRPLPHQYEFARLNLTRTIMSKRKLLRLVENNIVNGWDDPRLPTICGLRRRGFTAAAIRAFAERIGISKVESVVEHSFLEHCVREDLNKHCLRAMAVLRPLKVVIENYPEGQTEMLEAVNNPEDPAAGTRQVPFGREIYVEQEDFREEASKDFFRLSPGKEVRLRYAYFLKCERVIKNANGEIEELRCTYDPSTKGGNNPADGRKVKATIHWLAAAQALPAQVRLYDHLFREGQEGNEDFNSAINPNSLETLTDSKIEPSLANAKPGDRYQFERLGYFCVDPDSSSGQLVFNRTTTLRDQLVKIEKKKK